MEDSKPPSILDPILDPLSSILMVAVERDPDLVDDALADAQLAGDLAGGGAAAFALVAQRGSWAATSASLGPGSSSGVVSTPGASAWARGLLRARRPRPATTRVKSPRERWAVKCASAWLISSRRKSSCSLVRSRATTIRRSPRIASISSSASAMRCGASKQTNVCGMSARLCSSARRSGPLRGKKPR